MKSKDQRSVWTRFLALIVTVTRVFETEQEREMRETREAIKAYYHSHEKP